MTYTIAPVRDDVYTVLAGDESIGAIYTLEYSAYGWSLPRENVHRTADSFSAAYTALTAEHTARRAG